MTKPIYIDKPNQQIELNKGKHGIYILGGWGIKLGYFSVLIRSIETGEIFNSKKAQWPVQKIAFNKRAKRIFVINVPKKGTYEVIFKKHDTIEVKQSNLLLFKIFSSPLSNEKISIYFE